jgi:hypothetical protein
MTLSLRLRRTLGILTVFLTALCGASASTIILDDFTRSGPNESLTSQFTAPSTATTNSYSGFVEVMVSGTGYSLWTLINDAFHGVPGGSPLDSQYYQLNIGWTGFNLAPLSGESHNINNFIVFVEGVGAVAPGYTPAYDANHTYHFVVDTGLLAGQQLQFGVSDGNFGDNGGAYNLSIWQLEQGASTVPEHPAPYAAMGMVFVLAFARWRQRR